MRRAVKSPHIDPRRRLAQSALPPGIAALAMALIGSSLVGSGGAQPMLLGGGSPAPKTPPPLDPDIPRGPSFARAAERPEMAAPPACSLARPVCVHRGEGVTESTPLEWLEALEVAYRRLVDGVGAPCPLPDWQRGGSASLDLYLRAGSEPLRVEPDEPDLFADRASAFCTVGDADTDVARSSTLCVAEAIAWRLDAAETPHARRALATFLWWLTGTPTSADARAVDDVQSRPELGLAGRELRDDSEGAALFFDYLDQKLGGREPGFAALSAFALSAQRQSGVSSQWTNEPDLFDVLRSTLGGGPAFARFMGDLATARAFMGSRAPSEWPAVAWTGDFGRVRFDWSVTWSSLPRRLAPLQPIAPLGSTYLWLDIDEPTGGASLAFVAEWESPVAFAWSLVTVDAEGRRLTRVDAPYLERATRVERTLVHLEGARGVIVAGTNIGDLSPTYPFDPDYEPFEPHGYVVQLAKL